MFTTDTRTETFLNSMGVEFKYTNSVQMEELHEDWDKTNLSRPVPIRDDAVNSYKRRMQSGSPAPAPILRQDEDGKYHILDGVQRIMSAFLNDTTRLSAYVVSSDSPKLLTSINVLANARLQGYAESPEFTRRRAVEVLVIEGGIPINEVAQMGDWPASQIKKLVEILGWKAVVKEIGGPENMYDTVISLLPSHTDKEDLRKNANIAAEFLRLFNRLRMSAEDCDPYFHEFFKGSRAAKSRYQNMERRLTAIMQDEEIAQRIAGRQSSPRSADINLRSAFRRLKTTVKEIINDDEVIHNMDEFFKLNNEIGKLLKDVNTGRRKSSN